MSKRVFSRRLLVARSFRHVLSGPGSQVGRKRAHCRRRRPCWGWTRHVVASSMWMWVAVAADPPRPPSGKEHRLWRTPPAMTIRCRCGRLWENRPSMRCSRHHHSRSASPDSSMVPEAHHAARTCTVTALKRRLPLTRPRCVRARGAWRCLHGSRHHPRCFLRCRQALAQRFGCGARRWRRTRASE